MITEDYVSFETAKLLKEKGFDGNCSRIWAKEENVSPLRIAMSLFVEGEEIADRKTVEQATNYNNKYKFRTSVMGYLCPTLQMVMKWLRDIHNLDIFIPPQFDNIKWTYSAIIVKLSIPCTEIRLNDNKDKKEEAFEAAIKYCLKNLI